MDDIVAMYLYRFGDAGLPLSTSDIGERLGMGRSSLTMRIANFRSLDSGDGLGHWSKQSEKIYLAYKEQSQEKLKLLILRAFT